MKFIYQAIFHKEFQVLLFVGSRCLCTIMIQVISLLYCGHICFVDGLFLLCDWNFRHLDLYRRKVKDIYSSFAHGTFRNLCIECKEILVKCPLAFKDQTSYLQSVQNCGRHGFTEYLKTAPKCYCLLSFIEC